MSDNNVRWEPIQGDWYIDGVVDIHTLMPGWIEYNDDGNEAWIEVEQQLALPPDIRLCRATPAPTWSQEPPGEAGDWWVWRAVWTRVDRNARPQIWRVYYDADDGELLIRMPSSLPIAVDDAARQWPDTWYMPATVSQPPGEVGNA